MKYISKNSPAKDKTCGFFMLAFIFALLLFNQATWACAEGNSIEQAYVDSIRTNYENDPPTVELKLIYCGKNFDQPAKISIEPHHITATAKESSTSNTWIYSLNSEKFSNGGFFEIQVYPENNTSNITIKNGNDQYAHIKKTKSRHYAALASIVLLIIIGFSKTLQKPFIFIGRVTQHNLAQLSTT